MTATLENITRVGDISETKLPAGEYLLGDPCYSIDFPTDPDIWQRFVAVMPTDVADAYEWEFSDGEKFFVLAADTLYGDGSYPVLGTDLELPVDAGLLGVVPVALLEKLGADSDYEGIVHKFTATDEVSAKRTSSAFVVYGDRTYVVDLGE